MKFADYDLHNLKNMEYRRRIFVVFFWVTILLIVGKCIESVFFNHIPPLEILRDLIYGFIILVLEVVVLEKAKTLKK